MDNSINLFIRLRMHFADINLFLPHFTHYKLQNQQANPYY